MNDLLCCCCPSGSRNGAFDVSYSIGKAKDKKGFKQANQGDKIPDKKEAEMEHKVTVVKRSFDTSFNTPGDKNANAYKEGNETKKSSSYSTSHSVTKVTISSRSTNRSTNVVNEEVVSTSADRRRVDLPEWMIGIRSSTKSPSKRTGGQIDLEPHFAGMFETEKKEEPTSSCKATEVIEEIYPVQYHRRNPVLFLESLDGGGKGDSGNKDRETKVPFDDKLFNIDVPGAPKTRSHRETSRGVYERSISPAYKKADEPALNLHHLDTIIQRGNQTTVESRPPESNGLLQTQTGSAGEKNSGGYVSSYSVQLQHTTVPKRTEDREGPARDQETHPVRSQTSRNSDGANEEVVTMSQDRRKIDMPDWFLPNQSAREAKDAGVRVDLERQFAGMFDVEKKERNRPYQTRQGVYERSISPATKKTDQSALNLHHLDSMIPRSDQVVVESHPPSSSGPSSSPEGDSTHKGSYTSSYSVQRTTGPKRTEDIQSARNQETNAPSEDVDEAVVTVSEDHRKIDIPDWFLPNKSSKPAKRFGRDADIERQFSSMIKVERKETSTPKGTEVVEEIYPVEDHKKSHVLFLESLEGDHKGNRGAKEHKRDVPLDDKLFDTGIPDNPTDKGYRETRRKVYEKRISAEAKKPDQPSVNLKHLDTLIQRSKHRSEESQSPPSNGQPQTDKKQEVNDEENQDEDDEYTEEIILVEYNRKLRLPKWFMPHAKKAPRSMDCLNDILQVPQPEQHSTPHGGTQVNEELLQEIISDRKAEISLHHLLKD